MISLKFILKNKQVTLFSNSIANTFLKHFFNRNFYENKNKRRNGWSTYVS